MGDVDGRGRWRAGEVKRGRGRGKLRVREEGEEERGGWERGERENVRVGEVRGRLEEVVVKSAEAGCS